MRTITIIITCFLIFGFHPPKSIFGFEEINAFQNGSKIGNWILFKKTIDTLKVDFKTNIDTLIFYGYCDAGCLDGSKLTIKDENQTVLTEITRKSRLQKIDSLRAIKSTEKTNITLEHMIVFKVRRDDLKQLYKGIIYSLYLNRSKYLNNKEQSEEHIFYIKII